eukprot:scaffold13364_cov89-Skeletonema_marinoi.AAC.1
MSVVPDLVVSRRPDDVLGLQLQSLEVSWQGLGSVLGGSCCCTCSLVKSSREMDRQKTDAGFQKLGMKRRQTVSQTFGTLWLAGGWCLLLLLAGVVVPAMWRVGGCVVCGGRYFTERAPLVSRTYIHTYCCCEH